MKYLFLLLFLVVNTFASDVIIRSYYATHNTFIVSVDNYYKKCADTPLSIPCSKYEVDIKETTMKNMDMVLSEQSRKWWNDYIWGHAFHSDAYTSFHVTEIVLIKKIREGVYRVVTKDSEKVCEYEFFIRNDRIYKHTLMKKVLMNEQPD